MAFDPDAYLAKKVATPQQAGFNPDAYLAKKTQPQTQPTELEMTAPKEVPFSTKLQAAASGFGKATTFGYFPRISAAIEPYVAPVIDPFVKSYVEKETGVQFPKGHELPVEDYVTTRDIETERLKKAEREAPGYALGGTAAGILGTAPVLPGAGAAATGLGRIAQAAKLGGAYGLLQAPEPIKGEQESLQLEERAKQGLMGAAAGGLAQGAFEGVKTGLTAAKSIPEKLRSWGAGYAFKATGANKTALKKAGANVEKFGEVLMQKGVVKPGATVEDIADAAEGLRQKTGEELGSLYKSVTEKLSSKEAPKELVEGVLESNQLANELESVVKKQLVGEAGAGTAIKRARGVLNDLRSITTPDDVVALNNFKSSLDNLINYSQEFNARTPAGKALSIARTELNKRIQSRIDSLGKIAGEDLLSKLKQLNTDYAAMAAASNAAKDRARAQLANRYISPTDYAAGIAGTALGAGGPKAIATGLLGAGVNKLAREYGAPIVSTTAYKAGGLLKPAAKLIPPAPPAALIGPSVSRGLLQK